MAGVSFRMSCSKPRIVEARPSSAASPARRWLVRNEIRRGSSCSWRNGVGMSERLVDSRITSLHRLIAALHERVAAEPVRTAEVLPELLEDLHTALEELHVAEEEQYQQNEALAAARLTAEAERQRYQELFDFAPDGYLVTDPEGIIQEANRAAAVLLGVPQPRLLDRPLVSFVAEEERPAFC